MASNWALMDQGHVALWPYSVDEQEPAVCISLSSLLVFWHLLQNFARLVFYMQLAQLNRRRTVLEAQTKSSCLLSSVNV
jgi:hypothetical protein